MKRILAALAVLLALASPLYAQSGTAKAPAALITEFGTSFPDNTTGAITPLILRQWSADQVASFLNVLSLGGDCTASSNVVMTCTKTNGTAFGPMATVASGTSGGVPFWLSATTIGSSALLAVNSIVVGGGPGVAPATSTNFSFPSPNILAAGVNGTVAGAIDFANGAGGGASVRMQNLGTTAAWNFNLPSSAGVAGQPLISQGGVSSPQTYGVLGAVGGGTNNAFFQVAGPAASIKTYTFPNSSQTMAALDLADQTISGGANVTTLAQSTGNITVDCGARPIQTITNGGAFTITAPVNPGYCILDVTNNATAGAITFSGFSVGANTGDTLTTTNTNAFLIFIYKSATKATYSVKAFQ